ncbi:MAG: FG-GAP-like repeat-containing protein, partial [Chloroflexi bacterium]|nr:FG-GAP-like repeat-containing protein [Chloroflexota bacterium]
GVAFGVAAGLIAAGQVTLSAIKVACAAYGDEADDLDFCQERVQDYFKGALDTLALLVKVADLGVSLYRAATNGLQVVTTLATAAKIQIVLIVITTVIQLALTITIAILSIQAAEGQPFEELIVGTIVAEAVVSGVVTILLAILSIGAIIVGSAIAIVVAIFLVILALVDLILWLTTGTSYTQLAVEGLASFFYDASILTELDTDRLTFGSPATWLGDESAGLVSGNTVNFTSTFSGTLQSSGEDYAADDFRTLTDAPPHLDNGLDDPGPMADLLTHGHVKAALIQPSNYSPDASVVSVTYQDLDQITPDCAVTEPSGEPIQSCTNDLVASFVPHQPQVNLQVQTTYSLEVRLLAQECTFEICWVIYEDVSLPEDEGDPTKLYFDILPAALDDLWPGFDTVQNADADADGLPDAQEGCPDPGCYPSLPDSWDADGDGLSDAFEINNEGALGTNALDADSDDDGLLDGQELALGTAINNADSDGDGLADGLEIAGWLVLIPDGSGLTYIVYGHPLSPDSDGDGLTDRMERDNRTSPYAANDGPRFDVALAPVAIHPTGWLGHFARPGDPITVTVDLNSVGEQAVTAPMTACLPGALLEDVQGGTLLRAADNVPIAPFPTVAAGCNGQPDNVQYTWDFGGPDRLERGEHAITTLTAGVRSDLAQSLTGTVDVTLLYADRVLTHTLTLVVDADNPSASITTPAGGSFLRGAAYVVGGAADDPTSWVQQVELRLDTDPGSGVAFGPAVPITATISPWAYTWALPADGLYTLEATATDLLGHQSEAAQVTVTVDNTPPVASLDSLPANGFLAPAEPDGNQIVLSGSAADNLSGVTRVQISIDHRPWQEVAFISPTWTYTWTLPPLSGEGRHVINVRAWDQAGNVGGSQPLTATVDTTPPADTLITNAAGATTFVPAGQPITLTGYANDAGNAPLPARPAELLGEVDTLAAATVWLEAPAVTEFDQGASLAWLGDFNGDGRADLAVGLPNGHGGNGRVAVILGRGGDWPVSPAVEALADGPVSYVGPAGAALGAHLRAAGDVNGDGLFDLLVGDPANGRAYLVFGTAGVPGPNRPITSAAAEAGATLFSSGGTAFGAWLAAAGDVNGDGLDDLLLGQGSSVYLLLGRRGGLWGSEMDVATSAAAVISPLAEGATITGVGDVNGDQYDDFAVVDAGQLYLFLGDGAYVAGQPRVLELAQAEATFGGSAPVGLHVAALGDVNGDDLGDFIYSSGDRPRLVYGRTQGDWNYDVEFDYAPPASGFLVAPGDVNADGLNDLLLGTADGNAYLVYGGDLAANHDVAATLTDVAAAAHAPYAAGADLNCDLSSELLLLPDSLEAMARTELAFTELPFTDPDGLPQGSELGGEVSSLAVSRSNANASFYVDDDWLGTPPGQDPDGDGPATSFGLDAFADVQSAVDAAVTGTHITLHPGVYAGFQVVGSAQNDLIITGVDADAIFIEADDGDAYAIQLQDVTGVEIANVTLRQADTALSLVNAGHGGHEDEAKRIRLRRVVIHSFSSHAVSMDRASSLDMSRSTIIGQDGSGSFIQVNEPADPDLERSWSDDPPPVPTPMVAGSTLVSSGSQVYALPAGNPAALYSYTPGGATWLPLAEVPADVTAGSVVAADQLYLYLLRGGQLGQGVTDDNPADGVAPAVYAVAVDPASGDVYVGGRFNQVTQPDGQHLPVNNIARWDGSQWYSLGTGVREDGYDDPNGLRPARVNAIAVGSNGYVYVGGRFSIAGDRRANNIAGWNGQHWAEFDDGLTVAACNMPAKDPISCDAYVAAIALEGSVVYAGGLFDASRDVTMHNLARWNGNDWQAIRESPTLPDGVSGPVHALLRAGNDLLVGGHFDHAGTREASNIVNYEGQCAPTCQWKVLPLDNGVSGPVYALALDGVDLYVGGNFTRADSPDPDHGLVANHVARWDTAGQRWFALGDGANGPVYTLVPAVAADGCLYAGGSFNQAGGSNANALACWQPTTGEWSATSSGAGAQPGEAQSLAVRALVSGENDRYAGGDFTTFGRGEAANVARLSQPYLYDLDANAWNDWEFDQVVGEFPEGLGDGAVMVADGLGALYALPGGGQRAFYRYDSSAGVWSARASLPLPVGAGGALAWADGALYALPGGDDGRAFYRYDVALDRWTALPPIPDDLDA